MTYTSDNHMPLAMLKWWSEPTLVCLFVCLCVRLVIYLFIYLPIYLFICVCAMWGGYFLLTCLCETDCPQDCKVQLLLYDCMVYACAYFNMAQNQT